MPGVPAKHVAIVLFVFVTAFALSSNLTINGVVKRYRAMLPWGSQGEGGEEADLDVQVIQQELAMRKELMRATCSKYGQSLKVPLELYNPRLRVDVAHRLMYCENYKIASSTWAVHLLSMKGIHIERGETQDPRPRPRLESQDPRPRIHLLLEKTFPPLPPLNKELFLARDDTVSFLIVRDPFERLLSAYTDKMAQNYTPEMRAWETLGKLQRNILNYYRTEPRKGNIPTFREFVKYLVGELSANPNTMEKMTNRINPHWRPVYLNCGPCSEDYDMVMKMETLNRDSLYLKQKLQLPIEVEYVRNGGREGHTTVDRTVEAFRTVGYKLIRQLLNIYRIDFEMFGYSPQKYLNITDFDLD